MTTIIRYKDQLVCDSVYVSDVGGMIHKTCQEAKIYRHPHYNALIGISGFIDKPRYDLLMVHLGQFLLDLKTYPESNPNFDDLVNEIKEHYHGKLADLPAISVLIVTGKLSAVLRMVNKPLPEARVSIVGASTPIGIGTGIDITAKHAVLSKLNNRELTATDLLRVAVTQDPYSGGELFRVNLSELGEL